MKYFRLTWHQILWEMSWANLQMLSASIPSYSDKDDEDDENIPELSGNQVGNFLRGLN
jgi:hypothetical protein